MPRLLPLLAVPFLLAVALFPDRPGAAAPEAGPEPITVAATDWPWWRGPTRDGVAAPGQKLPLKWGDTEAVVWKAAVPGRGHGSPAVVGDQVFLAAAEPDTETQSLLCFDRRSGKQLWQTTVHTGGFDTKGNGKSSLASATPACDGRRVFINFLHAGAVWTSALSRDGKILWQTKVSEFVIHQGFGSSPALYEGLVLVSADSKGGGLIAGLDRATGKVVWKQERPKQPNYASPIVLKVAGRDQLLMTGCDLVSGFDPLTGKKLWEVPGSTTECVTSVVTDGQRVFTSGGYPKNHVSAVLGDGSGKLAWETKVRVYVPSMLVHKGHLYAVRDDGVAECWACDTGKEEWKDRLGGTFSSSPVLADDRIYAIDESGQGFVFRATPEGRKLLGEGRLGDEVLSTPAICGDRIYLRVAVRRQGQRQELLYCLGNAE